MFAEVTNKFIQVQDYLGLLKRNNQRSRAWAKNYDDYLAGRVARAPLPVVLQIIPTEACNLRCKMCNQWGENGYFLEKKRPVSHMPIDELLAFLGSFKEKNPEFLLSIHGGEPFCYKEMDALLDYIHEKKIDTFFTTNGTLMYKFAEKLARINRHTFYLLSVDGSELTNDYIRGKGTTAKIINSVEQLKQNCFRLNTGLPKLIVSYCVNEHNLDDIDGVVEVARKVRAVTINYNLRWFLPREKGALYDEILKKEFGVRPSGAWSGWMTDDKFEKIDIALEKIYSKHNGINPPYYTIMPRGLSKDEARQFYLDYDEVFDKKSCVMPSYMVRIHSSGEMIYCPGHPDIIPGNVFRDDFETIYYNQLSEKLRKHVEKDLLPVCNRCCGLYMTYSGTKYVKAFKS